jgi:hypothetical protein
MELPGQWESANNGKKILLDTSAGGKPGDEIMAIHAAWAFLGETGTNSGAFDATAHRTSMITKRLFTNVLQ